MEPLQPGQVIAGRYRIQSVLGIGGHACVYLAQQQGLERTVAIKVLSFEQDHDPKKLEVMRKRFEQEARLISQLRDPHTISMYDFGTTPEGLMYMAQEYIEGENLSDLFKREGQLAPVRVVKITRQLLLSLQEAHALGVLHRDIKPQNIMIYTHVGRRDQVKLLDFGIAKIAGEGGQDWTTEGSLVGTPRYIAPERIRGKDLTPASDLYAVGLVACELLTGVRVMEGLKGIRALQAQLSDPSTKLPGTLMIPGALRAIINKMMEKETDLRYGSAEQVLNDLENWDSGAVHQPRPSAQPTAVRPSNPKIGARPFNPLDLAGLQENSSSELLQPEHATVHLLDPPSSTATRPMHIVQSEITRPGQAVPELLKASVAGLDDERATRTWDPEPKRPSLSALTRNLPESNAYTGPATEFTGPPSHMNVAPLSGQALFGDVDTGELPGDSTTMLPMGRDDLHALDPGPPLSTTPPTQGPTHTTVPMPPPAVAPQADNSRLGLIAIVLAILCVLLLVGVLAVVFFFR